MGRILILVITTLATILPAVAQRKYAVEVGDFTDLRIENSIGVDYYCNPDSAGYVIVDATDHPDYFYFSNNGKGKLTIQTSADYPPGEPLVNLVVYSNRLEKITNSGDSLVCAHNLVPVEEFSAKIIGNGTLKVDYIEASIINAAVDSGHGDLTIAGKAAKTSFRNVGKGTIFAGDLTAPMAKASIVGTGAVICNPVEEITIMGMGSGTVFYINEPAKIKNRGVGIKHSPLQASND